MKSKLNYEITKTFFVKYYYYIHYNCLKENLYVKIRDPTYA